jgi:membrane protease YdiL (CAAX protease family)
MVVAMAVLPSAYKTSSIIWDCWRDWHALVIAGLTLAVAFFVCTDDMATIPSRLASLVVSPAGTATSAWPGLRWTFGPVSLAALGSCAALLVVHPAPKDRLAGVVTLVVFVALAEELVFRSALLTVAHATFPPAAASAITAASFGFWHAGNAVNDSLQAASGFRVLAVVVTMAVTGAASYVFTWVRFRSRNLGGSILAHVATNLPGTLLG